MLASLLSGLVAVTIAAFSAPAATIRVSPSRGTRGTAVTVSGAGLPARESGALLVGRTRVRRFRTSAAGRFTVTFALSGSVSAGTHTVEAVVAGTRATARFLVIGRWHLPQRLTWYWQLQGPVVVKPVQATDFDGFDNSAATVASFHAHRQHVICYIDAGTWENWRPDAASFPRSLLGRNNGWPGERWLDIRRLSTLAPIMTRRLTMCRHKGFDAVEPDNIDGWENSTGFPITAASQLTYNRWLARKAHALGLAVLQKNDLEQARALQPYFDGILDEQCNEFAECSQLVGYLAAGKPVLDAEYKRSLYPTFCTADRRARIMGALFDQALDGTTYRPCW